MRYKRIVQTGNIFEIYEYEKFPSICLLRKNKEKQPKRRERRFQQRRSDSLYRAKKSFQRLVLGNLSVATPALLTLTMLDLVSIKYAYSRFTAFGQRIKRVFGNGIAWIAVPEFQARGAVHFHVLIWNIPYEFVANERHTRYIQNLWGWGYVDILQTDGSPKLATYLSKYLSKGMQDDRLVGIKAYSATRNIVRSVSFNSQATIDFIQSNALGVDNLLVFERSYGTMWLGRCVYKRYELKI